jgi:mycofactocin system glycosyltransferase
LSDLPFPAGWALAFDPSTRRTDGGRVLIGGTPLRILRLSAAGAALVEALAAGEAVPGSIGARRLARRLTDAAIAHPVPPVDRGASARSERVRSFGSAPNGRPSPEPAHAVRLGLDDVTVVVPVLDDAGGLTRTLAALGPVRHVIVVDDGSADAADVGRPQVDAPGAVTVLRHDSTRGPAAARNTGWRAAATPVVAFVDAGVVADPGWLEVLLAHLGDPALAAVAPRVRSTAAAATPAWLAAYEDERSSLDLGPAAAPVRPGSRVSYVPTAALVVRRDALEALGGFDEALHVGEDVDLVWRLAAAGHRVRYEPAAGATHPCRPTPGAWTRQRFRYGTAAADLAARHGDAVAPLHVSGWSAGAWALVGLGQPVAGVALAAGATAALVPKLRNLDDPVGEAVRIAGLGNLHAGRAVADALRRPWWPAAVAVAALHRRSRPALLAAAILPPLLDRRPAARRLGPATYVALRLADDVAYGTGVLAGCWRHRSARALRPAFTGPIRRPAPANGHG